MPEPYFLNRSSVLSLSPALTSALAVMAFAIPSAAFAQSDAVDTNLPTPQSTPDFQAPEVGPPPPSTSPATEDEVQFSAELVSYDDSGDLFSAEGGVFLERDGQRLRADKVEWNRRTGQVVASGNVAATNPEGDIAYGDRIVLTDSLKDGVVDNLLVVMEGGARFVANQGERFANGDMLLRKAAYTPCPVEDENGCPREPSWKVKAAEVHYNKATGKVKYKGARAELFGIPIPLPLLAHSVDNQPSSGLLVPSLRIDSANGVEVQLPYYFRLAQNRDFTFTPHIFTETLPMLQADYRELNELGAFHVTAYATHGSKVDVSEGETNDTDKSFRGYLDVAGKYQISPQWSVTGSGRLASDRTFLRRYDISRDDRLRSTLAVERVGGSSYFTIAGWAVQTLRVDDKQGQQAIAFPALDFRQRLIEPIFAGKVELQVNSLALTRTAGQDTQRAFAGVKWDLRRLTPWGQEVNFTLYGRGDIYHSSDNLLTEVLPYRGESGWQTRGIAAAAVDVKWPFIGEAFGGIQKFTPRVQIVASPHIRNVQIPNEDSRAFDLEDSNLFALNRFPGYDRFEDGSRITYGLEWSLDRPGLAVNTIVGQSYRLDDNKPGLFPPGTGLSDRTSDIVGRTTVAYKDFLRVTHRYRLDKDNFAVRRNEVDARIGNRNTYGEIGYLRLDRDIDTFAEDLRDREEVRVGGRIAFARYWSVFGSAIVDLSDASDDPSYTTDGFEPIRHRLGIAYEDDCVTLGVTWRRDYEATGDASKGNSFLLRLAIRNLGI